MILSAGFSLALAGETDDVSGLLLKLQKNVSGLQSLKTDFVQEKNLSAFKKKIFLRGRIYLMKPQKLAWHVDEPLKYSVIITDEGIQQWDQYTREVQKISFSQNPVLGMVKDQLTAWFNGNFVSLQDNYDIHIVGKSPWVLEFTPKSNFMAGKVVKCISVGFQQDEMYLAWIKIQEINGDNTTITLKNTVLNPALDPHFFEVGNS